MPNIIPVLYVMGNDDFSPLLPEPKKVIPLHADDYKFNDYTFIGYEYSLPFVGGIYEKPEKEIARDMDYMKKFIGYKTILVSHSPAYGILDQSSGGTLCGSQSIQNFIKQNDIYAHIHGHVHSSFGNQGRHFNVSAGQEKRAMLIDMESLDFEIVT